MEIYDKNTKRIITYDAGKRTPHQAQKALDILKEHYVRSLAKSNQFGQTTLQEKDYDEFVKHRIAQSLGFNSFEYARYSRYEDPNDEDIIIPRPMDSNNLLLKGKYDWQVFGSASSRDYDVLVFVEQIGPIHENHDLIKEFEDELGIILSDKPVNANLGIVKEGLLVECFKGTPDELNNSCLYTYDNHRQYHSPKIKNKYDRLTFDEYKHLKLIRVARFIISFFSREPELRPIIKSALRGDFKEKIEALKLIDLTKHTTFPGKKEKKEDIYKVIAFQFGQIYGLFNVDSTHYREIYTKEEIIIWYPHLARYLRRESLDKDDLLALQSKMYRFIELCELEVFKMSTLVEIAK